jgi:hypothetical protein
MAANAPAKRRAGKCRVRCGKVRPVRAKKRKHFAKMRRVRGDRSRTVRRNEPTAMKTKNQSRKAETPAPDALDLLNAYQPSKEKIATFAYFMWKQRGCPDGHDLEDWFEAEQQLKVTHEQEATAGAVLQRPPASSSP